MYVTTVNPTFGGSDDTQVRKIRLHIVQCFVNPGAFVGVQPNNRNTGSSQTFHHPSFASHPYVNLRVQHVYHISHVYGRDLVEAYRNHNVNITVFGCWINAHITGYQQHIEQFQFDFSATHHLVGHCALYYISVTRAFIYVTADKLDLFINLPNY